MMRSIIIEKVPGTRSVHIFPYIRKIDLMSSNSYILSGEDQIALIDPGALDDQWDLLLEQIKALWEERPRPVVIYLTHIHLDHCFQLKRCQDVEGLGDILVAVQESGAVALESQDAMMTLAGLLGRDLSKVSVDFRLLSKLDLAAGGVQQLRVKNTEFAYFSRSLKIPEGPLISSQTVPLGKDDHLEIYSTPGHSPDSICLRAGRLLFVGDLFFAPNPGMAGAYGWSQPDLLESIHRVLWVLEQKDIMLCYSGHGRAIDADTAQSTLRSMYQDVITLSGLEEISPAWAKQTAAYAEDLMGEMERLFTIIAGKLAYISHVLEELEEEYEADCLKSLIDERQIDELFAQFNRFVVDLHMGRKLNWELVHKAGQLVGKLEHVFENRNLSSILDQSLLKRAKRLLNDYTVAYRGFRPTYYATDVDIAAILEEVLGSLTFRPYEEEAIIYAKSHEDYLWELRTRIAHINVFDKVDLECSGDNVLPLVRMDRERFLEAAFDLLERFASAGAKRIKITSSYDGGLVAIRIAVVAATGEISGHPLSSRSLKFFERAFAQCGGFVQAYVSEEGPVTVIEFYSVD